MKRANAHRNVTLLLMLLLIGLAGCRNDMRDGSRLKPLEPLDFFPDRQSARPLVEGTIAQGQNRMEDELLFTGHVNGQLSNTLPMPLSRELLERGQERFNIFCSPCHDQTGAGLGIVVRRGFTRPPSFHADRLREAPLGHFFDVMTRGFGAMYSYASRVPPEDRWAIAAYIRVLQAAQDARLADVPEQERERLQELEQ
jgi:mono/diheme cytochrome c family protein